MLGKYSPTVTEAYQQDINWFSKYAGVDQHGTDNLYDPEGYDMYGYDKNNMDRAGNLESDYSLICTHCGQMMTTLYHSVLDYWTFDRIKPVNRKPT